MKVGDMSTNLMTIGAYVVSVVRRKSSTNYLELGQCDNEVGLWGYLYRNIEQGVGMKFERDCDKHWLSSRHGVCDLYTYD